MTEHDFGPLFDQYPTIIAQMPETFNSHEFILKLAQQHQPPYIEALYAYISRPNNRHPTPFKIVHGILAKHLNAYGDMVRHAGETDSDDIFTQENRCAQWQRI